MEVSWAQQQRLDRARREPLYILDVALLPRSDAPDGPATTGANLVMVGTTQSQYRLEWRTDLGTARCSCPDATHGIGAQSRVWCKHVCYLLCRAGRLTATDLPRAAWEQRRVPREAADALQARLIAAVQARHGPPAAANTHVDAETHTDAECAICLETLAASTAAPPCPTCRHQLHATCLARWLREHLTCVYCRHPYTPENAAPPLPTPGAWSPPLCNAPRAQIFFLPRSVTRKTVNTAVIRHGRSHARCAPKNSDWICFV